jgi:hypothetical protein
MARFNIGRSMRRIARRPGSDRAPGGGGAPRCRAPRRPYSGAGAMPFASDPQRSIISHEMRPDQRRWAG